MGAISLRHITLLDRWCSLLCYAKQPGSLITLHTVASSKRSMVLAWALACTSAWLHNRAHLHIVLALHSAVRTGAKVCAACCAGNHPGAGCHPDPGWHAGAPVQEACQAGNRPGAAVYWHETKGEGHWQLSEVGTMSGKLAHGSLAPKTHEHCKRVTTMRGQKGYLWSNAAARPMCSYTAQELF